jgi:hypothetical protein
MPVQLARRDEHRGKFVKPSPFASIARAKSRAVKFGARAREHPRIGRK